MREKRKEKWSENERENVFFQFSSLSKNVFQQPIPSFPFQNVISVKISSFSLSVWEKEERERESGEKEIEGESGSSSSTLNSMKELGR